MNFSFSRRSQREAVNTFCSFNSPGNRTGPFFLEYLWCASWQSCIVCTFIRFSIQFAIAVLDYTSTAQCICLPWWIRTSRVDDNVLALSVTGSCVAKSNEIKRVANSKWNPTNCEIKMVSGGLRNQNTSNRIAKSKCCQNLNSPLDVWIIGSCESEIGSSPSDAIEHWVIKDIVPPVNDMIFYFEYYFV